MKKNSKLSIYLFAIAMIFGASRLNTIAQTIDILSVDATKYPKMKAEILVKDATNTEVRSFSNTDFKITDGGKARAMNTVFCSPNVKKFSLVITIDKTASMQYNPADVDGTNTTPPLKRTIAVNSAVKLVTAIPIDRSECALTAFASGTPGTEQIKYFTTDKDSLTKEINKIAYAGGTDINAGFLGKNGNRGALDVAAFGKWKPIIVFITDGLHDPQFTQPKGQALKNGEIVNRANAINASVFMVGLGVSLSGEMQSIATGTGGAVFNNLSDQNQLDKALSDILQLAQLQGDLAPCEIEWDTDCSGGNLEIEYQQGAKPKDNFTYSLIPETLPILAANPVDPNTILNVPIGASQLIDVELQALQNDVKINGDNSTKSQFKVANWNGSLPITLTKGTKKIIKVEYKPTDILCTEGVLSFDTDACTIAKINMKGGTVKIEDIDVGFATKLVPKNGTYTQKFCNNSCSDIEITGFDITGTDKSEFKINTAPQTVKSGECLDIEVTYTPSDVKSSAALYTIKTKSNNDFTANLIGTGSGLAKIQANDVTFEAIKCGELDKIVTIKNDGAIPLNITDIDLVDETNFTIVGAKPTKIDGGQSADVTIKFKPVGAGPNYTTDLIITNDSDNDKNKVVKLTASKFVINFNTNAGTEIDFGLLCPGETVTRDVEISNLSNTTLELTGSMVNGTGFSISKGSWSIPENGKEMVTITFTASADNNYTGTWTLLDDCGAKTINYNLKAQIIAPVLTAPITNYSATLGNFDEKIIKVTNPTGRDITFDAVSDNPQYTIITPNPATGIVLPKNSFIDITVRFTPIKGELPNGKINVTTTSCNYATAFDVIGDPKFATADLVISKDHKGMIGEDITIPVKLLNKFEVQGSGATSVQFSLEFDANLLEPTGTTPVGTITGNLRRITGTINLDGTNNNQEFPLVFKIKDAGAAVTETDFVFYTQTVVDNNAISITTDNGKFTLIVGKAEAKIFEKEAKPGDVIDFPIYIRDKDAYLKNFHKGIKTYLIYNATVLEPIGLTPTIVNGDQNKGQIEITQLMAFTEVRQSGSVKLAPETGDILLTTVRFRAMLGNEVVSKIMIANSTTIEGKIEITPDSTNFSLLGVCTDLDGSVRLINPFLQPASIDISPNPASTAIKVKVTALEPGYHTVKVYDLVGHLIAELLSKDIAAGDYELILDNTNLDAGNYMVIFDTPTQSFTKTINVVK